MDKLPMDERVQFTDRILEDIMDSAEDPIGGGWRAMPCPALREMAPRESLSLECIAHLEAVARTLTH